MSSGSITGKRALALQLKYSRQAAGLSMTTVAKVVGTSQASVSRIERAQKSVTADQLYAMASVYGAPKQELSRWLRMLADLDRTDQWWHKEEYRPWLSTPYAELIEVENGASSLTSVQLQVVPGLLQTPDYSRALLEHSPLELEPERINTLVRIRQTRARRLHDPNPPMKAVFFLSEAVLDLQYGSREVHTAQMRHLLKLANQPNVTIGVLPYSKMIDIDAVDVYELPDGSDPVVYTESLLAGPHIENRFVLDDVDRVKKVLLSVQQRSLTPAKSVTAIEQRTD